MLDMLDSSYEVKFGRHLKVWGPTLNLGNPMRDILIDPNYAIPSLYRVRAQILGVTGVKQGTVGFSGRSTVSTLFEALNLTRHYRSLNHFVLRFETTSDIYF